MAVQRNTFGSLKGFFAHGACSPAIDVERPAFLLSSRDAANDSVRHLQKYEPQARKAFGTVAHITTTMTETKTRQCLVFVTDSPRVTRDCYFSCRANLTKTAPIYLAAPTLELTDADFGDSFALKMAVRKLDWLAEVRDEI